MRILLCGGAGYIGSHFAREVLRNTTHSLVIVDNLQASRCTAHVETRSNWVAAHPLATDVELQQRRFAELEVGDVRDSFFLDSLFVKYAPIDVVVHMCGDTSVSESVVNPLLYYDNNVISCIRLLQAMQRHACDKIIFSSTAALFGVPHCAEPQSGTSRRKSLPHIFSSAPPAPESPYGFSKLMSEWILRDCASAYGIKAVCLRYFNACGAHPDGDIGELRDQETHLIPLVLRVPLASKINAFNSVHHPEKPPVEDFISVFGTDYPTPDGTCVRDYVHVSDLATAHLRALEYLNALTPGDKSRCFSTFNLGTSHGYSVREVIEAAQRVTGHAIPMKEMPRRAGDSPVLVASGEEAMRVLGWTIQFDSIEKIVETAWKFHQRHPTGSNRQFAVTHRRLSNSSL